MKKYNQAHVLNHARAPPFPHLTEGKCDMELLKNSRKGSVGVATQVTDQNKNRPSTIPEEQVAKTSNNRESNADTQLKYPLSEAKAKFRSSIVDEIAHVRLRHQITQELLRCKSDQPLPPIPTGTTGAPGTADAVVGTVAGTTDRRGTKLVIFL